MRAIAREKEKKLSDGNFNRILTLLRKERGLTQKDAAASLGISQALLSHYEKGIRECGLDFVVRAADFYGVSCDYLLGRSPDRSGLMIQAEDIPEDPNSSDDNKFRGSLLPVLGKKLIINSVSLLYEFLFKNPHREMVNEVTNYLNAAVYKMFRIIYSGNRKNQDKLFSIPESTYSGYVSASMMKSEADLNAALTGGEVDTEPFLTSSEKLSEEYPQLATSLFNLIQQAEKQAKQ